MKFVSMSIFIENLRESMLLKGDSKEFEKSKQENLTKRTFIFTYRLLSNTTYKSPTVYLKIWIIGLLAQLIDLLWWKLLQNQLHIFDEENNGMLLYYRFSEQHCSNFEFKVFLSSQEVALAILESLVFPTKAREPRQPYQN